MTPACIQPPSRRRHASRIDPRGPQVRRRPHRGRARRRAAAAPSPVGHRAARRSRRSLFARRGRARRQHDAARLALPAPGPAAARRRRRARGRGAAAVRPGRRPGLRRRRARRLPRRRRPSSAWSPSASRSVAALLNAVFGFCLGCEIYLLVRPGRQSPLDSAHEPPPVTTHQRENTHEPRELTRHRPVGGGPPRRRQGRPDRGRRGHHRLRQGPHQGRHQARLDDRPAGPGPPRLRQQGAVRGAALRAAASPTTTPSCSTAATTTGSPPTPTGTSSSTATTTSSCSTAAARSGSSTPASSPTSCPSRATTSYTAQEQDPSIRAFRDETVEAIGTQNLVDVRSPDEYAGRLLAPAHLPQEQAQRAGHIPTAANVPWSKAANDDGTFKSDDELKEIYTEAGVDWDKDTIAYCRIGERSSHTWFVLKELLGQENVKNYDGSWTEYGSLVGVPVALGDEPGRPDVRRDRGRALARRRRHEEGGDHPGPGRPRTASRSERLRAPARPHR